MAANRLLLPDNYYNAGDLGGTIKVTIPKGRIFDFFYVKLDSVRFLNDARTMVGSSTLYALPVKIVGTSAEGINEERNQVLVAIKYQASFDGWYLHESTIVNSTGTRTEKYFTEADNQTYRLTTRGPFTVRAVAPTSSAVINGLQFDITVSGNSVSYGAQITGQPLVEPVAGKPNSYDPKTRNFELNFKYKDANNNDVTVSSKLIFRNRIVDGISHPRAHLVY